MFSSSYTIYMYHTLISNHVLMWQYYFVVEKKKRLKIKYFFRIDYRSFSLFIIIIIIIIFLSF